MKRWAYLLALMVLSGNLSARGLRLSSDDADAVLEGEAGGSLSAHRVAAVGDFDGDGRADIALVDKQSGGGVAELVLGGRWRGTSPLSDRIALRVKIPSASDYGVLLADLNGDGRQDLILTRFAYYLSPPAVVWVLWGRPHPTGEWDLNQTPPDLTIHVPVYCRTAAAGDVNGDGIDDLLLGASVGRNVVYLVWGRTSFPAAITAGDSTVGAVIQGPSGLNGDLGTSMAVGDLNGDGIGDILLSATEIPRNGVYPGVTYGIFGASSASWTTWDLAASTPSVVLWGGTGVNRARIVQAVDVTGDGRAELFFTSNGGLTLGWMDAADALRPEPPTVSPGSASIIDLGAEVSPVWGDFDGDGRTDLFVRDAIAEELNGHLTSAGFSASTAPAVTVDGMAQSLQAGDVDGDGRADLLWTLGVDRGAGKFWRAAVLYGFHPLWDPRLTLGDRRPNSPRVDFQLAVEGAPSHMRWAGDVLDPPPGVWLPYRPRGTATLTPAPGLKTLSVVFRDSGGHESDPVSRAIVLEGGGAALREIRNCIEAGGEAFWELSSGGGRFRAVVYSSEGVRVRVLDAGDRPAGAWMVRWDGRDGQGRRAAPGTYLLMVEAGEAVFRRRLLLR